MLPGAVEETFPGFFGAALFVSWEFKRGQNLPIGALRGACFETNPARDRRYPPSGLARNMRWGGHESASSGDPGSSASPHSPLRWAVFPFVSRGGVSRPLALLLGLFGQNAWDLGARLQLPQVSVRGNAPLTRWRRESDAVRGSTRLHRGLGADSRLTRRLRSGWVDPSCFETRALGGGRTWRRDPSPAGVRIAALRGAFESAQEDEEASADVAASCTAFQPRGVNSWSKACGWDETRWSTSIR